MNIDDVGRHAGQDLQHTSNQLEASLPSIPDLVERGRRLRARRNAAGLAVLMIPLAGGVAFAASGSGGEGGTQVATEGGDAVPSEGDGSASTSATDAGNTPSTMRSCSVIDGTGVDGGVITTVGPAVGTADCATTTIPDPIDETTTIPDPIDDDLTTTSIAVTVPPDDDTTTTTTIPDPVGDGLGRVSGYVLAGPTCPVETPDQSCGDVGIVATITFTMIRDDAEFLYERTVTSAPDGSYSIELAPGRFSVTVTSEAAMWCTDGTVTVTDGETATLDISCDTGIR